MLFCLCEVKGHKRKFGFWFEYGWNRREKEWRVLEERKRSV